MPNFFFCFSRFRSPTLIIAFVFFFLVAVIPYLLPEFWNWIDSEKYYLSFSEGVSYGGSSYGAYLAYASFIKSLGIDYIGFQTSIMLLCSFSLALLGIVAGHTNNSHILFFLFFSPYFYRLIFAFQRQAIALSLVFIGFFLLFFCNRFFSSVITFLLASIFHLSSIFLVFVILSVKYRLLEKTIYFLRSLRIPRSYLTSKVLVLSALSSLLFILAFFSSKLHLVILSKAITYRPDFGYSLFVFLLISLVVFLFTRSLHLPFLFFVFSLVFGFTRTSMLMYFLLFALVSFSQYIFTASQFPRYSNSYYRAFRLISILGLPVTTNILLQL